MSTPQPTDSSAGFPPGAAPASGQASEPALGLAGRPDVGWVARALGAASGPLDRETAEALVRLVCDPALAPGDTVGPFRVVREVGRGSVGVVYLAERADVGLRVALKVLSGPVADDLSLDPDAGRFADERRCLAALAHPNVARFYDAGQTDEGRLYVAMEFVAGLPIAEYAGRRGLRLAGRIALFEQLCAAVAHVHGRGLVHGDVSPSNVLVTESDGDGPVVKLLDFGLAAPLGAPAGGRPSPLPHRPFTPGYTAPEVVAGGLPTPAADVYALGAVLRDLLTGLPEAPGSVPPALWAVLSRALSADGRYRSAAELARALCAARSAGDTISPGWAVWAAGAIGLGALALGRLRKPAGR